MLSKQQERSGKTPEAAHRDVRSLDWEFAYQRRYLVTQSPDGMYQLLLATRYRNLLLHNLWTDSMTIIQRNVPYRIEHETQFIDERTFYIHCGEEVDFYDAATAKQIPFLEMSFGHKHGDKHLLGFCHSQSEGNFAAVYVEEEPPKAYGHKYHAALFGPDGKVLDDFKTEIDLVQQWGKVVGPMLNLHGNVLTVHARQFTADYHITFFQHETEVLDKALV